MFSLDTHPHKQKLGNLPSACNTSDQMVVERSHQANQACNSVKYRKDFTCGVYECSICDVLHLTYCQSFHMSGRQVEDPNTLTSVVYFTDVESPTEASQSLSLRPRSDKDPWSNHLGAQRPQPGHARHAMMGVSKPVFFRRP